MIGKLDSGQHSKRSGSTCVMRGKSQDGGPGDFSIEVVLVRCQGGMGYREENRPLLMFSVDTGRAFMPINLLTLQSLNALFVSQRNLNNLPSLLWFLFLPLRPREDL